MRSGAGAVDITPAIGVWMSGYGGRQRSESVHDPLFLQALALEGDGGDAAVIVGADVLGFDYDFVHEVRTAISERHRVAYDAILLNGSHTHGGPAVINHLVVEAPHIDAAYRQRLHDAILEAVDAAFGSLTEVDLYQGWGRCAIGINRRHPDPPHNMFPNPRGFYDDTVGVLACCNPGTPVPRQVLFNASCHPTTLGSVTAFTADWPGAARNAIEAWLPETTAIFVQAACGNIRPRTYDLGTGFTKGSAVDFERMGHACAHEVIRLLGGEMKPVTGKLTARRVTCELPLENRPGRDDLERMSAGDDKYEKCFADYALAKWPDGVPATLPYEAQVITIGDAVSILALPGEVVSELGDLARRTIPRPTLFCGYSNGLPCYVPSAKIRRQGGYEAGLRSNSFFGLPGWLKQESELVILEAVEQAEAG